MNYLLKIGSTGAIRKTPGNVLQKIRKATARLPDQPVILEAGAGTGEITEVVLQSLRGKSHGNYYAFEIDDAAIEQLAVKFPNLTVVNGDVFTFDQWVNDQEQFDLFISSIPLSFYSPEKTGAWLENIRQRLSPNGMIIIVLSAFWLIPGLLKKLPGAKLHSFFTFPQYFMIAYQHRRV